MDPESLRADSGRKCDITWQWSDWRWHKDGKKVSAEVAAGSRCLSEEFLRQKEGNTTGAAIAVAGCWG
jgi:hypothetical protein